MNKTIPARGGIAANVTSVTYCYSPSLPNSIVNSGASTWHYLALSRNEVPLFLRQGDYWVIRYQGDVAFLKATRGLQCLSLLLHHPGREFHVSEFLGLIDGKPALSRRADPLLGIPHSPTDAGPILDAQAKAQYKLRLDNLRADLQEAEQSCDPVLAEQARSEIAAIVQQLASAAGLGGRDRRSGSEAERARSAVTKRIKDSICKIGTAIPSLRRHLVARIKTGYFCSYNLSQEHPVGWRFLILLIALCSDRECCILT
jgi:hypothetical protein